MGNSKSSQHRRPHSPAKVTEFQSSKQSKASGIYPHEFGRPHGSGTLLRSGGFYPHESSTLRGPIKFHDIHGVNIEVTESGEVASRTNSFCYAIAFTSRSINVEERVHFNLKTVETGWSGVMRFGFTHHDPATLEPNDLPRYACPDLTNLPGYWAKAVPEDHAVQNNVLSFYVNHSGSVFYSVNDRLEGLFLDNVDVTQPLWGIVDIYGNTTSLRLIENFPPQRESIAPMSDLDDLDLSVTSSVISLPPNMDLEVKRLFSVTQPIIRIGFSATMGKQLKCRNRKLITRRHNEWESTLAFTNTPLSSGDSVYMYCACTEANYLTSIANMAFGIGITTCDPSKVHVSELPVDSSAILDRPEYWIIYKEFDPPDEKEYFMLSLEASGCLTYSRENKQKVTLFHVDVSQPLYLVFDLCTNVKSLAIVGMSKGLDESGSDDGDILQRFMDTDIAFSLNHMASQSFFNSAPSLSFTNASSGTGVDELGSRLAEAGSDEEATGPSSSNQGCEAASPTTFVPDSPPAASTVSPLEPVSSRAAIEASQHSTELREGITVGDVAAMSAPLVMSALSWLGSTMVNRLRSSNAEDMEVTDMDEGAAMAAESSSSSSESRRSMGSNNADAENFFNARDDSDASVDSSDDDSLEDNFEINSRLLDILNADLNELLRPLEPDGGVSPLAPRGTTDESAAPGVNSATVASSSHLPEEGGSVAIGKECVVCCDSPVNAVVYACGHACMCYQCGQIILRQRMPSCPICRARVKDIIRIYEA